MLTPDSPQRRACHRAGSAASPPAARDTVEIPILKDYPTREEQVALQRVFLLAPKPAGTKGETKGKVSSVDFSLEQVPA